MLEESLLFSPITSLAAKIREREISPVELTESYLARLDRFGPRLNAVVAVLRDKALAEARQAEREIAAGNYRGPLHGIPYGAKDLLATEGDTTTWGAPPLRDQVFEFDATVVRRLRDAGAVLLGKLAMLELAGVGHYRYASASLTGAGLNPWDPRTYTGGSSSGSGSSVAAGLVGFSLGSETWGSILTPASFCGISGLRPTYGRVSRFGAMSLAWSMDKIGPMCRSVQDCAAVLSAIASQDPNDTTTISDTLEISRWPDNLREVRIGVVQEDFERHGEPEVKRGFEPVFKALADRGAAPRPVKLPDFPYDQVAEVIVASEAAASFETLIRNGKIRQLADTAQQAGILAGLEIRAVDYLKAMRLRTMLESEFARMWEQCDVLIGPTSLTVAPPVAEEVHELYLTSSISAGNLLGLPAITVPCGFGKGNLPIGLSVMGPAFGEERILQVANCYQQHTNWHKLRPPQFSGQANV